MSDCLALATPGTPLLLSALYENALKGCVLVMLAGVATFALRRHSAAARHLTWALALLGLLGLPVLTWGLPRWPLVLPLAQAPEQVTVVLAQAADAEGPDPAVREEAADRSPRLSGTAPSPGARVQSLDGVAVTQVQVVRISTGLWVLVAWGFGVCAALVPPLFGVASLARLARSARVVDEPALRHLLDELCQQIGFKRRVHLVQSARRLIPMTWGVFRTTVLLPDDAGAWPRDVLRAVLLHELAHVRRADCLTQLLGRLACVLHWFNPLAWLALGRLRCEQERACDDYVLNFGTDPSDYAEQLLMIVSGGRVRVPGASGAPAMGASARIEQRLRAILDVQRARRPLSFTRLGLAGAVALGCTLSLAALQLEVVAANDPRPAAQVKVQNDPAQVVAPDTAEVLATIRAHYIKDSDESALRQGAIKGLVEALDDPYSQYLDPKQMASLNRQVQGTLTGIGAILESKDGKTVVRGTLPDSPAFKAGLKRGDVIVKVDGKAVDGLDATEVVRRVVGAAGSAVALTVLAEGGTETTLAIIRAAISIDSIEGFARGEDRHWNFLLDPGRRVAYVRINQFSSATPKQLRAALEALGAANLKGLILDLRDCPGGTLESALSCVKLFVAKGPILSIRGRDQAEQKFEADDTAPWDKIPLVVLINGRTASSAEIVSGALRDNDRAVLVGTRTFGKGSVQTLLSLKDDQGAIKLTTAYFYLPSGRNIDRGSRKGDWGVDPTHGDVVRVSAQQAESLRQRREARADGVKPAVEVTPESLATQESDPQLAAAFKALIGKLTDGKFASVGEADGQQGANDERLEAARKHRQALLDDLKKVDRELDELDGRRQR